MRVLLRSPKRDDQSSAECVRNWRNAIIREAAASGAKRIGIAGMMMIAIGSATYMLLARHLAEADPSSISRTLQGFLSGIGFLGGAVIFKSGFDVKGIKAAAAVWITGAIGLAIATSYWWLGRSEEHTSELQSRL